MFSNVPLILKKKKIKNKKKKIRKEKKKNFKFFPYLHVLREVSYQSLNK